MGLKRRAGVVIPVSNPPLHRRPAAARGKKTFDIDEILPVIRGGSWPPGFTVSREQIYDEFGRLTGGPQDEFPEDR